MTANPFAALLDGVPRFDVQTTIGGDHAAAMYETDVLAALAAAYPADLAEAGKVLEGVTPGPWEPVSYQSGTVQVMMREWNNAKPDPMRDGSMYGYVSAYMSAYNIGWQDENDIDREKQANARFIAWCRGGVPALLARIAAQEAQIKGLEKDRDRRTEMHECAMSERDDATLYADEQKARAEAAETALAAMTKERDEALHFLDVSIAKSPEPLKALGSYLADLLDEDDWPTADRLLNGAVAALAAEKAKTAKLVEAVLLRVAETLAGMTYREVSKEARARIKRALDAAITEAGHE